MEPEILIPLSFFALVFAIIYILVRKKERLALIAKGADATLFESKMKTPSSLKWGLLFVGIGTGILLGKLFAAYTCLGEEASFFSMICLCGGLSLMIYHFIEQNLEKKSVESK
jgi:hypothetical protein